MTHKIAFVDDEIGVLESIKWVFKKEPYQLFTFQSPRETLENLKKNEFAVVVSDQVMPTMEGTSLLQQIKTKYPKTECMIMTAHHDLSTIKKTSNQIIKKPWDIEELKSIVKGAVDRYEKNLKQSRVVPEVNKCILYVENDDMLIDVVDKILSHYGYGVVVTSRCTEAIRLLQSQPDLFDLVITDMKMPDMDGRELSKKLLQIRPDIPIILCTGLSSVINKESIKSIGIRDIIPKPFRIRDMTEAIQRIFNEPEQGTV